MGEVFPFFETQGFGAAHGVNASRFEEGVYFFFGPGEAADKGVAEGFAFLAVARFGKAEEGVQMRAGDVWFGVEVYAHDGGIHLRDRIKRLGGDAGGEGGVAVDLHTEGEQAHLRVGFVGALRRSTDALGNFTLNGQDDAGGGMPAFEQVADDGGGDVVGDVGDDEILGDWGTGRLARLLI